MQPHRMTGAGVNVQLAFVIITGTMCPWAAARVHVRAIKTEIKWESAVSARSCPAVGGREREKNETKGSWFVFPAMSSLGNSARCCCSCCKVARWSMVPRPRARGTGLCGLAASGKVCCRSGLVGIAWHGLIPEGLIFVVDDCPDICPTLVRLLSAYTIQLRGVTARDVIPP